jgi:serine/threonine-protein kinase
MASEVQTRTGGGLATSVRTIGRYKLFGEIAAGGMAAVHLGKLMGVAGFARTVAVKRLHAQYAKDPDFRSMFLDEARLAARIRHPNVVPTLDIVETDGEIFLVMEYVQGASLSRLLRSAQSAGTPPDPWLVATILSGVLHGLHAAHEARSETDEPLEIVHRDVSPQNVLVGIDGTPRLLDFGVAKAVGRLQTTREGQVKGKFGYMAPEQIRGRDVTRQADIFAVGVVAWEALTGRRLFLADNDAAVIHAVMYDPIKRASEVAPELPPELDAVVMRALERDPARRYATAREMALELERLGGIAPASEVAAWVDSLAHTELVERQSRIAELERSSSEVLSLSPPVALEVTGTGLHSDVSSIAVAPLFAPPPGPARSRWAMAAGLFVAGAVIALTLALLVTRGHAPSAASASAVTPPAPAKPSATTPAAPASTIVSISATDLPIAEPPSMPVTELPVAPPTASSPTPAPSPRRRPVVAPAAPPPAPASTVNCDPPYWIDESGHTRYKPACL